MARRPTKTSNKQRASKTLGKPRRSDDSNEPAAKTLSMQIRPKRRIVTPFRLLMLGVSLIVIATVFVKLNSHRRDGAEWELKTALGKAEAALKNKEFLTSADFLTSAKEYQKACAALDVLKRNDVQERTIRQRFKEATAAGNLLRDSLFEILSKLAEKIDSDSTPPQIHYENSYTNRWIVMETIVERMEGRTSIDFPFEVAGLPVEFEANLPVFKKLPADREQQKVILAAQLQIIRLQRDGKPSWLITLQPETAFLWTDYETFQALGFENEDAGNEREVKNLLEEQSRLMGVER